MKTMRTPWISGDVCPARPGVYQRKLPVGFRYARWKDGQWLGYAELAGDAANQTGPSDYQCVASFKWRGLAYHEAKRAGTA